jgi:plastocyanin
MRNRNLVILLVLVVVIVAAYVFVRARNNSNSSPNNSTSNQPNSSSQNISGSDSGTGLLPGNSSSSNTQSATSSGNNSTAGSQNSQNRTIAVSGMEFAFSPNQITVNKGDKVKIDFTNNGTYPHNWTIDEFNAKTATVSPGQTTSVTFTPDRTGTFQFYCSVPGHKDQGMVGQLTVK